jgi:four helix bundle protein
MSNFRFERLVVWQRAIEFAEIVYEITERFPRTEQFGLMNQMRRAAVSVSSNIAEGDSRASGKERVRFLEIAYGSLMEVVSQSAIAQRRKYLPQTKVHELRELAELLARMMSGLQQRWSKG